MSNLKTVGMELIHANPYRMIEVYPWIEAKLDSLVRSIKDVGFWEGVIARPNPDGKGYQIAFGHHRIEAAKRAGMNKAPIIVRDLTDEQMIQFMGRENGEDYKADFIIMLNAWEGAIKFLSADGRTNIDVAKLLGWTELHSKRGVQQMNKVAASCANAHKLIKAGHMEMADFEGMSVSAVRDLVAPAIEEIKTAEKREKQFVKSGMKTPAQAKKGREKHVQAVISGTKVTATQVRRGDVASKDVRNTTRANIGEKKYGPGGRAKIPADFIVSMRQTSESIHAMLNSDGHAKKLEEALNVIPNLPSDYLKPMRQIMKELECLSDRSIELIGLIGAAIEKQEASIERDSKPELKMIEGGAA